MIANTSSREVYAYVILCAITLIPWIVVAVADSIANIVKIVRLYSFFHYAFEIWQKL